jgi:tetratricopeptide (TPR) repeat protein
MVKKDLVLYNYKYGRVVLIFHLIFLSYFANTQEMPLDSLTLRAEKYIDISVDSVLKYALPAIKLAEQAGKFEAVSDNYTSIQKAYYQNNEMDSAMAYVRKALSISDRFDNDEKKSRVFHSLGIVYYKTGNLDSALFFYQKEYELEKQLGRLQKEASALGNIGMVYYRQSKYQKAIDTYFQCLKIFQDANEDKKVMLTYNNIGNVYRYWEDYPKALFYYKKAMEIAGGLDSKRFSGFMNNNLAIIYRKQLKYDSAIVYYNRAKGIYEEINYQKGVASALTGLAITYNKIGEFDKSYKIYLKAIKIQKKVSDRIGLASNYGNLAILLLDEEKPKEAIEYLKKSNSIAKAVGYREVQKNNYETFRDAYAMLGNYKKALDYELKFVALKDSIYNIEKLKEIEDIQEKYQAEQKQHKIDILNEQARINDVKLSRKNIVIVSLVMIALLALIIGWLINHNNKTKATRNFIVLENKLLRSQMNPHFMFNSLNAIQTYILRKNPLEGASYLAKFAELMRSILYNSREEFVIVEKEITMISNYLELQQIRFNNLFSYSIDVDPDIKVKKTLIPPMLAQPFIENAVEHGFKDIDYPGILNVSFKLEDEGILITIKDNGVGVERSKEQGRGKEKLHKSLATVISKERLDLFNKRMKKGLFSLDIKQLEDEKGRITGTEVRIKIPFRLE